MVGTYGCRITEIQPGSYELARAEPVFLQSFYILYMQYQYIFVQGHRRLGT